MTRICALDTSSPIGTFALAEVSDREVRVVLEREQRVSNAHGESILPLIDDACRELAWSPRSIGRFIVGIGPGSFTGTRIATSLVKGIVMATGAEVAPVTSFEVLSIGESCAITFVDAMKGDRYVQTWREGQSSEPLYLPAIAIEKWLRAEMAILGPSVALVGDVPEFVDLSARVVRRSFVRANEMIAIGLQKASSSVIEPLYVRSADIHMKPV